MCSSYAEISFFTNYLEFISYRFQTSQFLYELQSIFFDTNRGENT